jgi:hypothetical protein
VTLLSVATREPPAAADTKIPRVTILSVAGSVAATEAFEVPTNRGVASPPPAPPAPSKRENPQPLKPNWDASAPRVGYGELTAPPLCTHAPDYSWLVGVLGYVPEKNVWTVRFAAGGGENIDTVTLIAPGPLTGMTSGQLVRVEGQLVAPSSGELKPGYRVRSVSPVNAR